jgi:hypothetical protein
MIATIISESLIAAQPNQHNSDECAQAQRQDHARKRGNDDE